MPPEGDETPTVGQLIGWAPPWPREWAQRLGREVEAQGGRLQVARARNHTWELRWILEGSLLLALWVDESTVTVRVRVGPRVLEAILLDPNTDDGLRSSLRRASPRGGMRSVSVPLTSARLAHTLVEIVRLQARLG